MSVWVALIYLCSPVAPECMLIGAPNAINDEQSCWMEASMVSRLYIEQGFTAQPYCHQISLGLPA